MVRRSTALAFLLLIKAGPLAAQSPGEAMFPELASCYLRLYTAEHLASHPAQKVTWMMLVKEPHGGDPTLGLWLRVTLRGQPGGAFDAISYCKDDGGRLSCAMEGDAGGFMVEPAKNGAVLLTVGKDGIGFENDTGFVVLEPSRGDDRSFLLQPNICP